MSQPAQPTTTARPRRQQDAPRPAHPPSTSHPPRPPAEAIAALNRAPRTALLDRLAMRVGLLLLLWASRPTHIHRAEAEARLERQRLLREHDALPFIGPVRPGF